MFTVPTQGERGGSCAQGWVGERAGSMNGGYNGGPPLGVVGGFGGGGGGAGDTVHQADMKNKAEVERAHVAVVQVVLELLVKIKRMVDSYKLPN